jgi:hypothetical protein
MKKKTIYVIGICAAIIFLIAAFFRNSLIISVPRGTGVSDTVIVSDTLFIEKPAPCDTIYLPSKIVKLPIYHTDTITISEVTIRDSVEVEIPIVQREYKDSTFQAWVSGYEPSLDSIRIFEKKTTITNTITNTQYKSKKFGLGVQLGVGINPKGNVNPYVGVGISYNLINL